MDSNPLGIRSLTGIRSGIRNLESEIRSGIRNLESGILSSQPPSRTLSPSIEEDLRCPRIPIPNATADPTAALFSFWTQWMEQSARGTQAMLEAMQSAGDLQHLQRNWLDPVARSIEEFMRTPVFLEAMKRNLKAATDLKRLQDQVVGGHGPPARQAAGGRYHRPVRSAPEHRADDHHPAAGDRRSAQVRRGQAPLVLRAAPVVEPNNRRSRPDVDLPIGVRSRRGLGVPV